MDKLQNRHLAHSVHFVEPGGNTWEIESYEMAVKAAWARMSASPWTTPLAAERFGGKGIHSPGAYSRHDHLSQP